MKFVAKVFTFSLLVTVPASAQVGNYKFLSGSGVGAWGVAVGTYKAILDGKNIDVFCVDFVNHVGAGNTYKVNITDLGDGSSLSRTRYGYLANQPHVYRQVAWLAYQFKTEATSQWGFIHAAIWNLTSGWGGTLTGTSLTKMNFWLNEAATKYTDYYYDNAKVLTDVKVEACRLQNPTGGPWNGCGKQEHLYFDGDLTAVPEPATMGLLALGLVGISGMGIVRRRQRRQ